MWFYLGKKGFSTWKKVNDDKWGFNIRIQYFQLTSHRALGPIPTKVREMLGACLTDILEYWTLMGEGKLVIFPDDVLFTWLIHCFLPTQLLSLTFFLHFACAFRLATLKHFLSKHKTNLNLPYFIPWAPHNSLPIYWFVKFKLFDKSLFTI